jgi:hypothetical protein
VKSTKQKKDMKVGGGLFGKRKERGNKRGE